jgi:hypothetical protein
VEPANQQPIQDAQNFSFVLSGCTSMSGKWDWLDWLEGSAMDTPIEITGFTKPVQSVPLFVRGSL